MTRVSSGFIQEMQQYPTEIDGRGLADVATHLVRARRGRDSWIADPAHGSFYEEWAHHVLVRREW